MVFTNLGLTEEKKFMNIKEIKDMISLMNENGLSELEMEKNGLRIKLKKHVSGYVETVTEHLPQGAPRVRKGAPPALEEKFTKTVEIKAPMVGTFYASPAPDSPPFIDIGKTIRVGDVVCIIEAMKLMNEIKSEVKGKVVEVLVENGSPVEFGQALFLVEPA